MDIMDVEERKVLVAIDYFSRSIWAKVLGKRTGGEVVEAVKEGARPVEIITDNGSEFDNKIFKKMCWDNGIEHRLVGVEAHRSNGRVERVIRTLREGLVKNKEGEFEERLKNVVGKYNWTYHSAIRCSPREAWEDKSGVAQVQNNGKNS